MVIDNITHIQTYNWRNDKNKLPFNWKCQLCGTFTQLISVDTTKTYKCSNIHCEIKLKIIVVAI